MDSSVKELKIAREYFEEVALRDKLFEIRFNDRNYHVGDILVLREYEKGYTGRVVYVKVTYILDSFVGLAEGYIAMSIDLLWGDIKY